MNDHDLLITISTKLDVALERMNGQDTRIAALEHRMGKAENWQSTVTATGATAKLGVDQAWKLAAFAFGFLSVSMALYTFVTRGGMR